MNSLPVNTRRFLRMIWVDAMPMIFAGSLVAGVLFLLNLAFRLAIMLQPDSGWAEHLHKPGGAALMVLLGFIYALVLFSRWDVTGNLYLMLPCQTILKFLSLFVVSMVGMLATLWISIQIGSLPLFTNFAEFTRNFGPGLAKTAKVFLILQPILFLGVLYFSGLNGFLKTIAIVSAIFFLSMFFMTAGLVLFGSLPESAGGVKYQILVFSQNLNGPLAAGTFTLINDASKVIFPWIEAPVLWAVAFIRFRELEA